MTATTSSQQSSPHRFVTERRPPVQGSASLRRDKWKSVSSFDDITESEEEDIQEPTSSDSSTTSERSPYAVYEMEKERMTKTRSFSLAGNPFLSPRTCRQFFPINSNPRLARGFSDPIVRRKSSLPTILAAHSPDFEDLLALPPIPEATTPSAQSPPERAEIFRQSSNDIDEEGEEEEEEEENDESTRKKY